MDDLLARHKKEQRDLIATTTSLKKQASKKTRKAVNQKCEELQSQLEARHKKEIQELNGEPTEEEVEQVTPEQLLASISLDEMTSQPSVSAENEGLDLAERQPAGQPKKRNRAKERLAKRQAQIEAVKAQAQEEAAGLVDYRKIEEELMKMMLEAQNLQLHEIQPDGHCLFRSVQDQLQIRHRLNSVTIEDLRKQAADYIRAHADDFIPYLFDEKTQSLRDLGEYTKELSETAMWGSDMELLALSHVYECPIKVLMAGSAPIVFNEQAENEALIVAFYKHSYGLGEHYNSCRNI